MERRRKRYAWTRFWSDPEKSPLDPDGFLYDPELGFGKYFGAKALESLSDFRCLALLGEPGLGKSDALQHAKDSLSEKGALTHLVALGHYSTAELLDQSLFQSPTLKQWLEGDQNLYLFLDSLDEGLLAIDTLHHFLVQRFRAIDSDILRKRLYLRITCRSADWPYTLGQELEELWTPASFAIMHLAPLRRVDVRLAANENGLNGEDFLDEVLRKEASPLAAKPVTLNMLLSLYQENDALPDSRVKLYEQGCLLLCADPNEDRKLRRHTGNLAPSARFAVASRIAAQTYFSNRRLMALPHETGPNEDEETDVSTRELAGGKETIIEHDLPIWEREIEDTLQFSALFASVGPQRWSWSHQTYPEFLAASYLIRRRLPTDKILRLIAHPDDPARRLAPQFHEVGSWLAAKSPELFAHILATDPDVLLGMDGASLDTGRRVQLVEILLTRIDRKELFLSYWGLGHHLQKLSHPTLENQLLPYLAPERASETRIIALAIAEYCSVSGLQSAILPIALASDEAEDIRRASISALAALGDAHTRSQYRDTLAGVDLQRRVVHIALLCPGSGSASSLLFIPFNWLYPETPRKGSLASTALAGRSITRHSRPSARGSCSWHSEFFVASSFRA